MDCNTRRDRVSKTLKFIIILFISLFFIGGCQSPDALIVSTYDERYDNEQRERYDEVRDYLFDEYSDDLNEMKKDDLYKEYIQLFVQYGIGNTDYSQSRRNKFSGKVDLDNNKIIYSDKVIEYKYIDNGLIILKNDTELLDDTFIRMVNIAEGESKEKKEKNKRLFISAGWLPIVTLIIGLTSWFNPRFVWYIEGGFRYKNFEPSSTVLTIIKLQAVIAFVLTIFLIWTLVQKIA